MRFYQRPKQPVLRSVSVPFWFSARLGLAVMGFFGFIFVYAIRVNLSVAIVCMVNRTAIASIEDSVNSLNASNVTLTEPLVDTECAGVVKSGNDTSTSDAVVSACILTPDGDGLLLILMAAVTMVVLVDTTPIVCLPVLSKATFV